MSKYFHVLWRHCQYKWIEDKNLKGIYKGEGIKFWTFFVLKSSIVIFFFVYFYNFSFFFSFFFFLEKLVC